jgi:chemotaxis protein methyltransferase CheR
MGTETTSIEHDTQLTRATLGRSPTLHETTNGISESGIFSVQMSDKDFVRLSEFIRASCGIKLPPVKKTMLEGRLRKRLRALGIESFKRYCEFLFSPGGSQSEYIHMIDAVTTNKTDFFREPDHFDCLSDRVLPELVHLCGLGKKLNVWSAACSTGEEPYTLAMVLSDFAKSCPGFDFSILATDISSAVLEKARLGIYPHDSVSPVPMALRKKYLLKSREKDKGLVRIVPQLRNTVRFGRLNFLEEEYGINEPMAIVFCRNALIYFDRPTQEIIINRLSQHLMSGGYLFVGHSESLHGMDLPLVQTATTIYRKQ